MLDIQDSRYANSFKCTLAKVSSKFKHWLELADMLWSEVELRYRRARGCHVFTSILGFSLRLNLLPGILALPIIDG